MIKQWITKESLKTIEAIKKLYAKGINPNTIAYQTPTVPRIIPSTSLKHAPIGLEVLMV